MTSLISVGRNWMPGHGCRRIRYPWRFAIVGLLALSAYSIQSQAGSSGRVGGLGGNGFGTVYCPKSDQRIAGLEVSITNNGNIGYFNGIRARCTPMSASGKWAGSSVRTQFQNGKNGWNNEQIVSRMCPDNMWVAGITGGTRKYGTKPVLTEVTAWCFAATSAGKRTGDPRTFTISGAASNKAGQVFCPGAEIAHGLTGKAGAYLDSIGFKCVQQPGKPSKPRRQRQQVERGTVTWSVNFSERDIQRFGLVSVAQASNLRSRDLRDVIVGNTVVRSDGITCVGCHASGTGGVIISASTTRQQACDQLAGFRTNTIKPNNLRLMIADWLIRRCPQ